MVDGWRLYAVREGKSEEQRQAELARPYNEKEGEGRSAESIV